jgi:hypothetical protein
VASEQPVHHPMALPTSASAHHGTTLPSRLIIQGPNPLVGLSIDTCNCPHRVAQPLQGLWGCVPTGGACGATLPQHWVPVARGSPSLKQCGLSHPPQGHTHSGWYRGCCLANLAGCFALWFPMADEM